jgi:L-seryl-tRNA(Ser) seleniumtransferase
MSNETLRSLPAIHELLETPEGRELASRTSHEYARERLREALDALRAEILAGRRPEGEDGHGDGDENGPSALAREAIARATNGGSAPSLRRIVNATGVVLHTNLGRAPLSSRALAAVTSVAGGYSNLEYDLEAGARGRRDVHGEELLARVLGCEAAAVANNNAAAVMLVLNTLAAGGEVVVSRGELVEIGGGFRIPEVLERAGCTLREVGTTNRTRAEDYERAVNDHTRLLLRVHPSNYRVVGFTARPSIAELADIARRHRIPLVDDLGSGLLVDAEEINLEDEPDPRQSLGEGADLVTFSGDKLLGGPQAGIVAGRRDLVERVRKNPLMRALRVDKMVYAALEATLRAYDEGRAVAEIPALRMLAASDAEIGARAASLADRIAGVGALEVTIESGRSVPGAGSAPGVDLPTHLVTVRHARVAPGELAARLRRNDPPVVARVERDRLVLDLRSVAPEDEAVVEAAIRRAADG